MKRQTMALKGIHGADMLTQNSPMTGLKPCATLGAVGAGVKAEEITSHYERNSVRFCGSRSKTQHFTSAGPLH